MDAKIEEKKEEKIEEKNEEKKEEKTETRQEEEKKEEKKEKAAPAPVGKPVVVGIGGGAKSRSMQFQPTPAATTKPAATPIPSMPSGPKAMSMLQLGSAKKEDSNAHVAKPAGTFRSPLILL